jgi:hypothetical protein
VITCQPTSFSVPEDETGTAYLELHVSTSYCSPPIAAAQQLAFPIQGAFLWCLFAPDNKSDKTKKIDYTLIRSEWESEGDGIE